MTSSPSSSMFFFFSPWLLIFPSPFPLPGSRQKESPGGDQGLHHPVPGQRGLPNQRLSQQRATAAGHSGLTTATYGVVHQSHLPGTTTTTAPLRHSHSIPKRLKKRGSKLNFDHCRLILLLFYSHPWRSRLLIFCSTLLHGLDFVEV